MALLERLIGRLQILHQAKEERFLNNIKLVGSVGRGIREYDLNGRLFAKDLNGDRTEYEYDILGNLKSVTLHVGDVEESTIVYTVDGRNRRLSRTANGTTTRLVYKDQLNPIAELNGGGTVVSRFVYGSKPNVPDYMESKKAGSWTTYRIISNQLGSPILIIDTDSGEIVQQISYDEYGMPTLVADTTALGFEFLPFGFAGGLYDHDAELVRFGARDYDLTIGRWTAKDTILFEGGDTNLYRYTKGDSVNYIDPNGQDRYLSSPFSLHQSVAVDLWAHDLDGNWVQIGTARFDFAPDDDSYLTYIPSNSLTGTPGEVIMTMGPSYGFDGFQIVIPSSPEQDMEMFEQLLLQMEHPPWYHPILNNCRTWATESLLLGLNVCGTYGGECQ